MSRRHARLRNEAKEVIGALVAEIQRHEDDYHHQTNPEVLDRAAAFLERLDQGRRRGAGGKPPS